MKRSGVFWLDCLSDDVREKWLNNYDSYFGYDVPIKVYLKAEMIFGEFIGEAFKWGKTQEGYDFWNKLHYTDEKKLIRNHKLKQLGI